MIRAILLLIDRCSFLALSANILRAFVLLWPKIKKNFSENHKLTAPQFFGYESQLELSLFGS